VSDTRLAAETARAYASASRAARSTRRTPIAGTHNPASQHEPQQRRRAQSGRARPTLGAIGREAEAFEQGAGAGKSRIIDPPRMPPNKLPVQDDESSTNLGVTVRVWRLLRAPAAQPRALPRVHRALGPFVVVTSAARSPQSTSSMTTEHR
jgi:hypothetical protein